MKKFLSIFLASIMLVAFLLPTDSTATSHDFSINQISIDTSMVQQITEESY